LAQDPLNNPAATPSPLLVPEYRVAAGEKSDRFGARGNHALRQREGGDRPHGLVRVDIRVLRLGAVLRRDLDAIRLAGDARHVLVLATVTLGYAVAQIATLPAL